MPTTAPSSITDAQLLAGGNLAALIDSNGNVELLQFRDVTVNTDGTVTLSHFLRGRRGSEQMTGAHGVGSVLVMLNASAAIGVDDLALSDINQIRYFKAVVTGETVAEVTGQSFTSKGRSLMPRAPWNVSLTLSGSDLTIGFDRRTRVGGDEWLDGTTEIVPLAEDFEKYEVDIYSGSSVVRTIQLTGPPPATYAAADIAADFGSMPNALTLEVYQMSGQVGRGFGNKVTLETP